MCPAAVQLLGALGHPAGAESGFGQPGQGTALS